MTAHDPRERGLDPAHILSVINQAADGRGHGALAVAAPDGVRVFLRSRRAADSTSAALTRVGYQVTRLDGTGRRNTLVTGWSAESLDSRLGAMRSVLQKLAAEPGATAVTTLDQLGRLPAAAVLLTPQGQERLISQAGQQLRAWISGTSGIHAPADPRARPVDPGCALRLAATRRAEAAIDDLAVRHLQVAEVAVVLYPALRQRMTHDSARDLAIQRAGMVFHLSPQQLGRDLTPLLRPITDRAPGPAASRPAEPPAAAPGAPTPATSPGARPGSGPRPGRRSAQEFPQVGMPVSPTSRPPSTHGATRPRGRTFPSGRPGPR